MNRAPIRILLIKVDIMHNALLREDNSNFLVSLNQ